MAEYMANYLLTYGTVTSTDAERTYLIQAFGTQYTGWFSKWDGYAMATQDIAQFLDLYKTICFTINELNPDLVGSTNISGQAAYFLKSQET